MARKLLAVATCLWLLLSGVGVYALAALEHAHDAEHGGLHAHDAADHKHADTGTDLFSQLLGQPAFDQLTSAAIVPPCSLLGDAVPGTAAVRLHPDVPSALLAPPPGPPPRLAALYRGGVFA